MKFLAGLCGNDDPPEDDKLPPRPLIVHAPERKEYFYFTAKQGDLEEVRGHVTAVWASCWGDPVLFSTAQLEAAQMPAIAEFTVNVTEDYLRAQLGMYQARGVLKWITKFYIDEPTASHADMARATAAVRKVCAEFDLPIRLMICIGDDGNGSEHFDLIDLFDDVATDRYGERASIADPGAALDRLASRLTADQRFYIVPGVNTGVGALLADEFNRLVQYALDHWQCGGMMPFTWFDRIEEDGSHGARSTDLRDVCVAAGLRFIGWNKTIKEQA